MSYLDLDAGYRVVRFDSRHVGLSTHVDAATATYGIDTMAGDALALLDAVGIDAAHLVGFSMGGDGRPVRGAAAARRVRSLTLVSSTPGARPARVRDRPVGLRLLRPSG